jgi:hypothetical protein
MKFSESDDAANGGAKGFIPESSLRRNPPVFAAILKIQPGQMTEVVSFTAPGSDSRPVYAIYKLLEKEAAGQRELSDPRVQQDIRQRLRDSRTQLLKAGLLRNSLQSGARRRLSGTTGLQPLITNGASGIARIDLGEFRSLLDLCEFSCVQRLLSRHLE